ncbi:MAG TPA: hypothetical protein DIT64_22165 [Verrucomicrobiales bacterium]|nr:hypothetical protein [Verrucomicrobiales bacterium]
MKSRFTALSFMMMLGSSFASTTFNLTFAIGDIQGLTAGVSKAILVADTGGNGFANLLSNPGSISGFTFANGSTVGDDMVIWSATASDFGGGALGFDFGSLGFNTANPQWGGLLGHNQQLGVLWFPTGSNSEGNAFGFYRSDLIEAPGDRAYFTPLDGATNSILTLTDAVGGNVSPSAISANDGVIGVPEPSRMILALLGFAGLMFRRRR